MKRLAEADFNKALFAFLGKMEEMRPGKGRLTYTKTSVVWNHYVMLPVP
jgi:hypothetical protein